MQILQKVRVVEILTENSKKEQLQNYYETRLQLEKEYEQLQFEQKKLIRNKKEQSIPIKKAFQKEMEKRKEKIQLLDFQIEQLHTLPLGSEIMCQEVTSIVNVQVGDCWDEKQVKKTIVLKDGMVAEIR